jgi:hypothetical protein
MSSKLKKPAVDPCTCDEQIEAATALMAKWLDWQHNGVPHRHTLHAFTHLFDVAHAVMEVYGAVIEDMEKQHGGEVGHSHHSTDIH